MADAPTGVKKAAISSKKKDMLTVLLRATKSIEKMASLAQETDRKNLKTQMKEQRDKDLVNKREEKKKKREKHMQEEDARKKLKNDTKTLAAANKIAEGSHKRQVVRRGKRPHEVDFVTPYCVKANPPVYEVDMACSVWVNPEDVSVYVDSTPIKIIIDGMDFGPGKDYTEFSKYTNAEYGPLFKTGLFGNNPSGLRQTVLAKVWHLNKAFLEMSQMTCLDTRCLISDRTVIELDRFADEINGEVEFVFRVGRGFTVNDPLAFNVFMREMQKRHPTFSGYSDSRGTKGITDTLHLFGIGPPDSAHAHAAPHYRGPRSTDPDKSHPDGERPALADGSKPGRVVSTASERDGLYFRRYEYNVSRIYATVRSRYFNAPTMIE